MSDALYLQMFAHVQSSGSQRRKRLKAKMIERLGRFAIYGGTISAFAMNATEPTLYASIASSICLLMECFR